MELKFHKQRETFNMTEMTGSILLFGIKLGQAREGEL